MFFSLAALNTEDAQMQSVMQHERSQLALHIDEAARLSVAVILCGPPKPVTAYLTATHCEN